MRALILLLVMSVSAPTQVCGDCTGDGLVDIVDVLIAAQCGVGLCFWPDGSGIPMPVAQQRTCDVYNPAPIGGMPAVDILDALWIARFLVGLQPTLMCTP